VKPALFRNVSQLKYRAIVARIRAQASSIVDNGNNGSAVGSTMFGKIVTGWTYDPKAQIFAVTVSKKPVVFSDSLVLAKMHSLVESVNV
jgi:hypothetical protein